MRITLHPKKRLKMLILLLIVYQKVSFLLLALFTVNLKQFNICGRCAIKLLTLLLVNKHLIKTRSLLLALSY